MCFGRELVKHALEVVWFSIQWYSQHVFYVMQKYHNIRLICIKIFYFGLLAVQTVTGQIVLTWIVDLLFLRI